MKLTIILSTQDSETNWNAFRLANLALTKGDEVNIFLLGKGVEYDKATDESFDLQKQIEVFLIGEKATIIACGTCMDLRHKKSTKSCPIGGIQELHTLLITSDKVLTF